MDETTVTPGSEQADHSLRSKWMLFNMAVLDAAIEGDAATLDRVEQAIGPDRLEATRAARREEWREHRAKMRRQSEDATAREADEEARRLAAYERLAEREVEWAAWLDNGGRALLEEWTPDTAPGLDVPEGAVVLAHVRGGHCGVGATPAQAHRALATPLLARIADPSDAIHDGATPEQMIAETRADLRFVVLTGDPELRDRMLRGLVHHAEGDWLGLDFYVSAPE